jgi:hypothetical protein
MIKKKKSTIGKIFIVIGMSLIATYVFTQTNFINDFIIGFKDGMKAN